MISIICAIGANNEIGCKNELLIHNPEDIKRFKKMTLNSVVIMGKNTYYSIKKPLKDRINVVITKETINGVECFKSLNSAIDKYKNHNIFLIGGRGIYEEGLKICDVLYLTRMNKEFPKADVFFPQIDYENWIFIEDEKLNEYSRFEKWLNF